MDALLTAWMAGLGEDALPTLDEASVSLAREAVRARGAALGMDRTLVEQLVLAASELAHNQLAHGRRGQIAVRAVERSGVPGLELVAADLGDGIPDPKLALEGTGPSARSLGAGLAAVRRNVHEMDLDVRWGEGTCVRVRVFAEPLPRRREVGVLGRAFPDQRVSGDHALFVRAGDTLFCAVIDGIGHGPLAHEASARAAATTLAHHALGPAGAIEACYDALADTRGAVMAVTRIDEATATLEHAAVGNVNARLDGFRTTRFFGGTPATLGPRARKRRPTLEVADAPAEAALILYTDGLQSRTSVADEPNLLREHPIVIAQYLMATFGRATDDALVLVAR
jgi:anti-sigma regulatory factor (Ser/Thr protein kinase)